MASTYDSDDTPLVVAVDFGTTYSGLAWCWTGKPGLNFSDIKDITRWRYADNENARKAPTMLSYTKDEIFWGFEAESWRSEVDTYAWFKLLLQYKSLEQAAKQYGTQPHADAPGETGVPTSSAGDTPKVAPDSPRKRTTEDLTIDYFRCLYQHLSQELEDSQRELYSKPIKFVITVPAIWSPRAKDKTLEFARAAGFGSRPGDSVQAIAEPEAAGLYVIQDQFAIAKATRIQGLEVGDAFVVCDAGGGTCDLITYEIKQIKPEVKIEELVPGNGGLCGSTFINKAFLQALRLKVGPEAFDNPEVWRPEYTSNTSDLMERFERYKKRFGPSVLCDRDVIWDLPNAVRCPPNPDKGILPYNGVKFTRKEIEAILDPTVNKVVKLVKEQFVRSKGRSASIKSVFLVGGFGSSAYLKKRLQDWGDTRNPPVKILQPDTSQQAVARGAVWSVIAPAVVSRKLRYNYGFNMLTNYNEKYHKPHQKIDHPFWGPQVRIIEWFARVGDRVTEETKTTIPGAFSCQKTDAEYITEECKISLFSNAEINPSMYPSGDESDSNLLATVGCPLSTIPVSKLQQKALKTGWFSQASWVSGTIDFRISFHSGEILKFTPEWNSKELTSVNVDYARQKICKPPLG